MEHNKKDGVSIKEFEAYAKKHRFELFFALLFVLAIFSTLFFWGPSFNIFCVGAGAVVSLFISDRIRTLFKKTSSFILHKEKMTQLVFAVVFLLVAIFISPVVFLTIGLAAGKSMAHLCRHDSGMHK